MHPFYARIVKNQCGGMGRNGFATINYVRGIGNDENLSGV
jgi:hypothetical protein